MMFLKKRKKAEPKKKLHKKENEGNRANDDSTSQDGQSSEELEKKEKPRLKKKVVIQSQKEKDAAYIMKKNIGMKVLRVIFWFMLATVFLRGAYEILKPTKVTEITTIINDFKREQKIVGDHPEEIMKFAQDFVKEYLTYEQSGEADFKNRIKPYVSKRISNLSGIYSFKNTAEAAYVNAYRKEEYAQNQYDVFVQAKVKYNIKSQDTDEIAEKVENCTLKVPVTLTDQGYCIEGLPLFVSDKRLDESYNPQEAVPGTEIDSKEIEPAISNFLDAYYSQDQSMINYLLAPNADQSKFLGLAKRYLFEKIETIHTYQTETGEIICLLKVKIQDAVNEETIYQEFNVKIIREGDKYYIQDINSKITTI